MADYERLADAAKAKETATKFAKDVNRTWDKNLEEFFCTTGTAVGSGDQFGQSLDE